MLGASAAAVELGRALRQAPAVAIHGIAVEALAADPVARSARQPQRAPGEPGANASGPA